MTEVIMVVGYLHPKWKKAMQQQVVQLLTIENANCLFALK
jgi:hypothetical protein